MHPPLLSVTAVLFALLAVLLLTRPAAASAVTAVALNRSCAADLAARISPRDGGPVRILGCDPADRGRAVIAFGDPATADDLAVLVPGSNSDLRTLAVDPAHPDHRPLAWARALKEAAGPRSAVVLWVGYPTPQGLGLDAAGGRLARAAGPALAQEVAGLRHRPGGRPHLTVVGHSYGAVVVALAADRLDADDLVLLGSPGARATDVAALHTTARVEAARAPDDWIRFAPHLRLGDLGHGTDPTAPEFGAVRLPADDARGHDGYFRPGSRTLAGIAAVVTGDHRGVRQRAATVR